MPWEDGLPDSAAYWWPRYGRKEDKTQTQEEYDHCQTARKAKKHRAYLQREAKRQNKKKEINRWKSLNHSPLREQG